MLDKFQVLFGEQIQEQNEKIEILKSEKNILQKHVMELKRENLDLQKGV